jgi:hypothetical protein
VSFSIRFLPPLRHRRDVLAALGSSFCLIVFASLVAMSALRVNAQEARVPLVRPDVPFAFSDFDGDLRPDLAVVQSGRSDLTTTDYWVRFQLSAGVSKVVLVVGPTGGLQVAARDVNGDSVPDLVLTTAWRDQPVAILLNDGNGNFSRIDPSAFPAAFTTSKADWRSSSPLEQELLLLSSPSRPDACFSSARTSHLHSPVWVAWRSDRGFLFSRALAAHPGRAPPLLPLPV